MKEVDRKLLCELVKNSRRSDRELSKSVGVSQPTISRKLKALQKNFGVTFTASPDLAKVGFEILAVTFGRKQEKPLETVKIQEWLAEFRDAIIFASSGTSSGVNADRMVISVHKNYSEYTRFLDYLRTEWKGLVLVGESFIISLKTDKVIKPLSIQDLFESPGK